MTTVDTFKNRLLHFIKSQEDLGGTSWEKINDHLLHEMGYKPNEVFIHSKLRQLRDENKIRFISLGDHTIFKPIS